MRVGVTWFDDVLAYAGEESDRGVREHLMVGLRDGLPRVPRDGRIDVTKRSYRCGRAVGRLVGFLVTVRIERKGNDGDKR